jgi:uncharacterized protein YneR
MKQKKPFYKKWWFWVLVFLFLLAMGNANTQKTAPADSTPVAEATKEEPQETPQEEEKDPITAIIDEQGFTYSDLDVVQTDSGLVKISLHYDDTSWDETDFCRECMSDYINICSKIYQIDGIEKVEYSVFVDLMDAKGNESSAKGFSMGMFKSTFNTYNWENIKYNPSSYKQIESDADIYIHPGIKAKVNFDKMYYKG